MTDRAEQAEVPSTSELEPLGPPKADPQRRGLASALRRVQEAVMGTEAPEDMIALVTAQLSEIASQLEPYSLAGRPAANSWEDLSRTANTRTLSPLLHDVRLSDEQITASLTFGAFYLGGNGATHGGAIPLVFDEALAQLAQYTREGRRRVSRTAYLKVDYRAVTPILTPLVLQGRVERVDGRKRFIYGAIRHGDVLTAEAEALYIDLRPGQP